MVFKGQNPIILFDGFCHLCAGVVKFIIRRDPKSRFRFSPLQPDDGDSIVLIDEKGSSTESTAALRIARYLRWPWPLLYGFILIPRPIRDGIYRWVARNRYRWFGKSEACMVPKAEWRDRFL